MPENTLSTNFEQLTKNSRNQAKMIQSSFTEELKGIQVVNPIRKINSKPNPAVKETSPSQKLFDTKIENHVDSYGQYDQHQQHISNKSSITSSESNPIFFSQSRQNKTGMTHKYHKLFDKLQKQQSPERHSFAPFEQKSSHRHKLS